MPKLLKKLFLAAHPSELAPLVNLGRKYRHIDGDVAYLAAGVGPVAAAFGLTHFLEDYRPQHIVAIGTAGVINTTNFKIGDVVAGGSVGTASGLAGCYTAEAQTSRVDISGSVPPVGAGFSRPQSDTQSITPDANGPNNGRGNPAPTGVHIYSPQEITRDETWRNILLQQGYDVEHLEAFAYAFVAQKFKIPLTVILGLTNVVGPAAHAEWRANAARMVQAACDVAGAFS